MVMDNTKGQFALVPALMGLLVITIIIIGVVIPVSSAVITAETTTEYPARINPVTAFGFHVNNTETLSGNLSYITLTSTGTANFTGELSNITILNSSGEMFGSSETQLAGNVINITGNDTISSNSLYTIYAYFYPNNTTDRATVDFEVTNITFYADGGADANLTITEGYGYSPTGSDTIRTCTGQGYDDFNDTACSEAPSITGTGGSLMGYIPLFFAVALIVSVVGVILGKR